MRRDNFQHIVRIHIVSFAQSREAETIVLLEHMHHEFGAVERLCRGVVEVEVERHLLLHQCLHRAPHGSRIHRAGRLAGVDAVRPVLAQILLRRLHHHLLSHLSLIHI